MPHSPRKKSTKKPQQKVSKEKKKETKPTWTAEAFEASLDMVQALHDHMFGAKTRKTKPPKR